MYGTSTIRNSICISTCIGEINPRNTILIGTLHNGFQLNQQGIDTTIIRRKNERELGSCYLSDETKEKLRDGHVIDLIDNHVDDDAITSIRLHRCVGLTGATLAHIAKFT